jgi:hypothetical protein
MVSSSVAITGSYNYVLVACSLLTGMFASWAARDPSARIAAARGGVRSDWFSCLFLRPFLRRRVVSSHPERDGLRSIADRPVCALRAVRRRAP